MKSKFISLLRGVLISSLFISGIIGGILVLNYVQVKRSSPLDDKRLEVIEEMARAGDEVIKETYRELHLLSRDAYFGNLRQLENGRTVLLIFLLLSFISFQLLYILDKRTPLNYVKGRSSLFGASLFAGLLTISGLTISFLPLSRTPKEAEVGIDDDIYNNWPSFRGPLGQGIAYDSEPPLNWDLESGEGITWTTKLKVHGFNSPVIYDDRIYLSGGSSELFVIYCYDFKDGTLLWEYQVYSGSGEELPEVTPDTGFAAATLAVDNKGVYGVFANGDLISVTHKGELNWFKNLGKPDNPYGHSSSLITLGDLLYVQYDHRDSGRVLAINRDTGSEVWVINREFGLSWSSPVIAQGNELYLILNSSPYVIAYSAKTGSEIWRRECLDGEVAVSSAVSGNVVFSASDMTDLYALDLETGEVLWSNYDLLPNTSSPVATDDKLYVCTSFGVIGAFDIETGELLWEYDDISFEGCYSSPISSGEYIYTVSRDGEVIIFRNDGDGTPVNKILLNQKIDTTPAFYKGSILFRTNENLIRVDGSGL